MLYFMLIRMSMMKMELDVGKTVKKLESECFYMQYWKQCDGPLNTEIIFSYYLAILVL